jgi:hypothetical protein
LNKYAYLRNNPSRYIERTGHETVGTGPGGAVDVGFGVNPSLAWISTTPIDLRF